MDQIVYASTAYTDLKSTLNQQTNRLIDFSSPPAGPADERLREAVGLLRPYELVGRELVRVGGGHDGGYLMAPEVERAGGAISLGVGPDVSWDADLGAQGIPVAMFDPTVRRLPTTVPHGTFHRIGVSGTHDASATCRPLPELVALAGLTGATDLLLKVDVEGAEWSAVSSLDEGGLAVYRQIVLEMHNLSRLADAAAAAEVLRTLRVLADSHLPIHIHANNYSRLLRFDDYWFPDAVEVSYLRKDLAGEVLPSTRIRSALDIASDQRVSDMDLEGVLAVGAA